MHREKKKRAACTYLDTTASLLFQKNILRLHVAMNDPVLVKSVEAL